MHHVFHSTRLQSSSSSKDFLHYSLKRSLYIYVCLLIKTTRVWLFLVFLFFLPRGYSFLWKTACLSVSRIFQKRLRWNYYSFASTNVLLKKMSRLIFNAVFKYLWDIFVALVNWPSGRDELWGRWRRLGRTRVVLRFPLFFLLFRACAGKTRDDSIRFDFVNMKRHPRERTIAK